VLKKGGEALKEETKAQINNIGKGNKGSKGLQSLIVSDLQAAKFDALMKDKETTDSERRNLLSRTGPFATAWLMAPGRFKDEAMSDQHFRLAGQLWLDRPTLEDEDGGECVLCQKPARDPHHGLLCTAPVMAGLYGERHNLTNLRLAVALKDALKDWTVRLEPLMVQVLGAEAWKGDRGAEATTQIIGAPRNTITNRSRRTAEEIRQARNEDQRELEAEHDAQAGEEGATRPKTKKPRKLAFNEVRPDIVLAHNNGLRKTQIVDAMYPNTGSGDWAESPASKEAIKKAGAQARRGFKTKSEQYEAEWKCPSDVEYHFFIVESAGYILPESIKWIRGLLKDDAGTTEENLETRLLRVMQAVTRAHHLGNAKIIERYIRACGQARINRAVRAGRAGEHGAQEQMRVAAPARIETELEGQVDAAHGKTGAPTTDETERGLELDIARIRMADDEIREHKTGADGVVLYAVCGWPSSNHDRGATWVTRAAIIRREDDNPRYDSMALHLLEEYERANRLGPYAYDFEDYAAEEVARLARRADEDARAETFLAIEKERKKRERIRRRNARLWPSDSDEEDGEG
jgi:hypothetical protein